MEGCYGRSEFGERNSVTSRDLRRSSIATNVPIECTVESENSEENRIYVASVFNRSFLGVT